MATALNIWERPLPATETRVSQRAYAAACSGRLAPEARRTTIQLTKNAARGFLALETRWRLNLLWRGLEIMEPDEALAVLDRIAALPSYQLASRRIDIQGARLAFRWVRFVESRSPREPVREWIALARVAPVVVYLAAARQARLTALACPEEAEVYKARARYWVAMAGIAPRR